MTRLRGPVNEQDHIQGPSRAPLTLLEYGDYQCPYCGQAYRIIKNVQQHFGNRLRFVFRNFPLTEVHPMALPAAEAAEAAGAQGKFWEMHDLLYENQPRLSMRFFLELANQLELDRERFVEDIENGTFRPVIRDDFVGGVRSGVNGTPCFFIDGDRYDGSWDEEMLIAALENSTRRSGLVGAHR
ncbi:MAG: thioredoxin domain-containing protein [Kofleriaceae bacterium]|nr:thioredoxin domain-containing protein [Kofleriaceae bacterium]